ncbi:MAG: 3-phosphoshikimate 1-carboxyvinyltransferase, partial [Acutalibacteraceae bacterium]|nr:3-phosphoshikimate 1-carboxyvinyltransferase [Acutalibacteraceae bacterium]
MDLKIIPSPLSGEVNIPPSKSAAHRALICAALAEGESRVEPFCTSKDIKATAGCLKSLGMNIKEDEKGYTVGRSNTVKGGVLDFCESGSTARFLLPVAAALGAEVTAVGEGRLPERPMAVLTELIRSHGGGASSDFLPITLSGKMSGGEFSLPGNISSQYISGLMLAAPLTEDDTDIILTTLPQSVGYIDMTVDAMKKQGVTVEETQKGWKISAGQKYKPTHIVIEGDWSQAAFFMSAAAIGGEVSIKGLDFASKQGDMAALDVFAAFGANISIEENVLKVRKGELRGIEVNAADIPDMVPAIAATAAFATGKTVIHSAERLRIKESDRIKTTLAALNAMGIKTEEKTDG